jgi:hypothetical protein
VSKILPNRANLEVPDRFLLLRFVIYQSDMESGRRFVQERELSKKSTAVVATVTCHVMFAFVYQM